MSYFKIYPKKLMVDAPVDEVFEARLFFNLEQYGHLHHNKMCPVELRYDALGSGRWYLVVTHSDIQLQEFDKFLAALNFYLFSILKYIPTGPLPETPEFPEEYFFQPIFFDALDGDIKPVTDSAEKEKSKRWLL